MQFLFSPFGVDDDDDTRIKSDMKGNSTERSNIGNNNNLEKNNTEDVTS